MFPSKKNKWYSVKIGAFSSLKDAGKYAATLNEKEKLPTFITNIYPKTKKEEKDFKKPKKSTVTSSHSKKSTSVPKAKTKKDSSPPKKSITASAPSKKSSGYTINVGSFQDKKLAQNLTKKLLKKGYPALMFPSKKNKWYRVKVGAFSSLKDAGKYAATLNEKEKLPAFITNIY
jgi:cell division septation protein DedD